MSAFSSQNPLYGLSQRPSNQGWLFHPKMPYTGNQDNFSAATGVHPNRFQHAFIQTQSIGGKPPIPPNDVLHPCKGACIYASTLLTKQFLTGQRPTPQASPKGAFSAVGGNAWHVSEGDMGKCALYIFPDGRLPFRCWEIGALCISFGLDEHQRRQ